MHKRILDLSGILKRKSVFLFGPRQTGKSTWLKTHFPEALYINLLAKNVFDDYVRRASALESDIEIFRRKSQSSVIIIDEIQKLPELLDEVHNQIELDKKLRFILTGSSARKLKRSGANLLGGRASWRNMFPLVYPEIKDSLKNLRDLERRLSIGGLPSVFDSEKPFEDLEDYVQIYLSEEIKAEGLVRNYEGFHRFLLTSAMVNARQVNFTEVANDAQVPPRTVHDYFQILEDTLIGFMLPPFTETPSRKAVASAKFYLFDTGVVNGLLGRRNIKAGTPEFGDFFEHFIIAEVRACLSYRPPADTPPFQMHYWRSTSKFEVDLILQNRDKTIAVEIKSKPSLTLTSKDCKGLMAFSEDVPKAKKIIVTLEGRHQILENGVECLPVFDFLEALWSGELFLS